MAKLQFLITIFEYYFVKKPRNFFCQESISRRSFVSGIEKNPLAANSAFFQQLYNSFIVSLRFEVRTTVQHGKLFPSKPLYEFVL